MLRPTDCIVGSFRFTLTGLTKKSADLKSVEQTETDSISVVYISNIAYFAPVALDFHYGRRTSRFVHEPQFSRKPVSKTSPRRLPRRRDWPHCNRRRCDSI